MTFKTACVMDNWEWRFHFATIPGPSPEGDGNEDAGLLLWNRKHKYDLSKRLIEERLQFF